ncbi:unnamed protein product [Echinostoma caproni]|uniref:Uncharacterized protein n=1 Tax=Echinostoma caproni TaxID=27848 RepID=A0A3P8L5W6_9TREM|nr:unnamed protein product [Echinostoma caproni]
MTSTVIECQKAGLKTASFGYAAMLLRPEYRDKLDPKHRRKFETLIRRPNRKPANSDLTAGGPDADPSDAETEPLTPCPSCAQSLPASVLYCTECRSTLPYCIITNHRSNSSHAYNRRIAFQGNHVIKNDLTICPGCQFPANYSDMMSFVENTDTPTCPMCSVELKRDYIRRITDPAKLLYAWITNAEESEEPETHPRP